MKREARKQRVARRGLRDERRDRCVRGDGVLMAMKGGR